MSLSRILELVRSLCYQVERVSRIVRMIIIYDGNPSVLEENLLRRYAPNIVIVVMITLIYSEMHYTVNGSQGTVKEHLI